MSMSADEAWRLVNALTDAARKHEQEALLGSHEGYSNAVQNENRAERNLVAALTGLSHERAEYHRPEGCLVIGPNVHSGELPANLVLPGSDDARESAHFVDDPEAWPAWTDCINATIPADATPLDDMAEMAKAALGRTVELAQSA